MLPFSQPPEFFCASLSFERNGSACRTSLHACFTVLHHWFLQRPPCSWGSCVGLTLDMMWDLQMVLTPLIIALLQHKLKVTLKVSWGWVGLMLSLAKVHLKILGFLNVYTVISPYLALPHRSGANFDILLHFLFLNIKYNTLVKNCSYFYIKVGKYISFFIPIFLIGDGKLESSFEKDSEAFVPGGKEYLPNY